MAKAKGIWAIDVGQCALKALHVQAAGEQLLVDAFEVIEHEQILSQPEVDQPALIRKALETLVSRHKFGEDPVIVAVPGQLSFARFTKLPPVEPKKIPDIVQFEAAQQIPFGIEEVFWDYQIFRSADTPEVEVGIFAMKKDLIYQHLGRFRELGIEPSVIQMAPLALYNYMAYDGLIGSKATILVDIGAENTDLVIAEGHRLWQRNIPLGGNNFTESLVRAFKLSFPKAEQLKRTAATSKYARQVFQTMRPVFADLSAEVQRSIGFYTSINRESEMDKAVALGNGFKLPGLQKFLQQNLGIPVEKVDAFNKLQLAPNINEPTFSDHVLALGVCYGLAVQGLGLARVNSNLLPPEIIKQSLWRKKHAWFIGAAACLAAAAGVTWLRYTWDIHAAQAAEQQVGRTIARTIDKYTSYKREFEKLSSVGGVETERLNAIKQIEKDKVLLPKILEVVTSALPAGQKELVAARDPEAYKQLAKEIPRQERAQVFIDHLGLQYVPALTEETIEQFKTSGTGRRASRRGVMGVPAGGEMGVPPQMGPYPMGPGGFPGAYGPAGMPPGFGGPAGVPGGPGAAGRSRTPGRPSGPSVGGARTPSRRAGRRTPGRRGAPAAATEAEKGFLLTIEGVTPHKEAPLFLTQTLLKELQKYDEKYARENKLPFWIEVLIPTFRCSQVGPSEAAVQTRRPRGTTARDRWGGGLGRRVEPEKPEEPAGPKDPLTGEPIENDWEFAVSCVIHLIGPEGKEKPAARTGAGGARRRRGRRGNRSGPPVGNIF